MAEYADISRVTINFKYKHIYTSCESKGTVNVDVGNRTNKSIKHYFKLFYSNYNVYLFPKSR